MNTTIGHAPWRNVTLVKNEHIIPFKFNIVVSYLTTHRKMLEIKYYTNRSALLNTIRKILFTAALKFQVPAQNILCLIFVTFFSSV